MQPNSQEPTGTVTDRVVNDLRLNPEWIITMLFAFFLGSLGVHRFYNGKIGTGILMLITFGGFGIWYIVDLIVVAMGRFRTVDGQLIPVRI